MTHDEYFDEDDLGPSKSERKRASEAVRDMGEELVNLPAALLEQVPMADKLEEAVMLARRIHQRSGRKRQISYIGKLLRKMDTEAIENKLAEFHQHHAESTARHHLIEQWRERLLREGNEAVTAFIDQYPTAEAQPLRQLLRKAQAEQNSDKPPRYTRELFRFLREIIDAL